VDETGLRKLSFKKNQYGTDEPPLSLRWKDGVFVPEGTGEAPYEREARERKAEQVFLDAIRTRNAQDRPLSHKPTSPKNYAPKVIAGMSEAAGIGMPALEQAMERLFQAGKIKVAKYGRGQWERVELS
jgi:RecA-family ATPase